MTDASGTISVTPPLPVVGLHHVKLPVADLAAARAFLEPLLGLSVELTFPDNAGGVAGVVYEPIGGLCLALRQEPVRARALAGWNVVALAVATRADLDSVAAGLDSRGVDHGPVVGASLGWILTATGPDGLELRFYTHERHG